MVSSTGPRIAGKNDRGGVGMVGGEEILPLQPSVHLCWCTHGEDQCSIGQWMAKSNQVGFLRFMYQTRSASPRCGAANSDIFFRIPRPKIHRNPFTDLKKVENAGRWSFLKVALQTDNSAIVNSDISDSQHIEQQLLTRNRKTSHSHEISCAKHSQIHS